MGCELEH
jgi:enamine deaminase RidA (YjgF/YER057c/UK114 family)